LERLCRRATRPTFGALILQIFAHCEAGVPGMSRVNFDAEPTPLSVELARAALGVSSMPRSSRLPVRR